MSSDSNGHSCRPYLSIYNVTYGKDAVSRLFLPEL